MAAAGAPFTSEPFSLPGMSDLKYLSAYSAELQDKIRQLIAQGRLARYLGEKYPERHTIQTDRALYAYAIELKDRHLRMAPPLHKVGYDGRLDVERDALGLHTAVSRVQGGKLKAKKEIRIAALFKAAPPQFLEAIVVHELAHLREFEHNKAFYRLCVAMLPAYHQLEFDLRVYLTWRDMQETGTATRV
jgi:predicted metal-dependent hydrolase